MNNDVDIEDVLRATLAEHVRRAPHAAPLAERIIAEADSLPSALSRHGSRRWHNVRWWRGWVLPAVAAGSVAAVVGAIVGVAQWHHDGQQHAASGPTPTRSVTSPSLLAGSASSGPQTTSVASTFAPETADATISQFRSVDLTFVKEDVGWALGATPCSVGSSSQCTEMMRTTNGGQRWDPVRAPGPRGRSGPDCRACIQHIRFADQQTGYAFGPQAMYMTTDGGADWKVQSGGATSLEVANGTALRVTDAHLQLANIGTADWHAANLPGDSLVKGQVVRALSQAYVPDQAGGYFASQDDGQNWSRYSNPCPGGDTIQSMTAAANGSLVVACSASTRTVPTLLTKSEKDQTFRAWSPAPVAGTVAATDANTVFVASGHKLYRGTDLGKSWQVVASDPTNGQASFLGFEGPTEGRWISGDGSLIWTTTDAGNTWTPRRFPD